MESESASSVRNPGWIPATTSLVTAGITAYFGVGIGDSDAPTPAWLGLVLCAALAATVTLVFLMLRRWGMRRAASIFMTVPLALLEIASVGFLLVVLIGLV